MPACRRQAPTTRAPVNRRRRTGCLRHNCTGPPPCITDLIVLLAYEPMKCHIHRRARPPRLPLPFVDTCARPASGARAASHAPHQAPQAFARRSSTSATSSSACISGISQNCMCSHHHRAPTKRQHGTVSTIRAECIHSRRPHANTPFNCCHF